jgi:hypothetical protein
LHPGRELDVHSRELAGLLKWRKGLLESVPQLIAQLARDVLVVPDGLPLRRQRLLQVTMHHGQRRPVAGDSRNTFTLKTKSSAVRVAQFVALATEGMA